MFCNIFAQRAELNERQAQLKHRAQVLFAPKPPCTPPDEYKHLRFHYLAPGASKHEIFEWLPNGKWKTFHGDEIPAQTLGSFMFSYVFPASFSKERDVEIALELDAKRFLARRNR